MSLHIAQPSWYRAAEAKLTEVAWLPYVGAALIIGITGYLLIAAWMGKPVKTMLVAWLVYLYMP